MPYKGSDILERELKKGSAELLILSLVEDRPRHGYDIGNLIEQRSGGLLRFNVASLYPLLYRLEKRRWIQGRWVEKAGQRHAGPHPVGSAYLAHCRHCGDARFPGHRRQLWGDGGVRRWDGDVRGPHGGVRSRVALDGGDTRGVVAAIFEPLQ